MITQDESGLFAQEEIKQRDLSLAEKMRPNNLSEFIGQRHILAEGKLLRRAIEIDRLSSLILYGPPGTGKTTLAHCISNVTKSYFEPLNAVTSNAEELRKVISAAKNRYRSTAKKTIIFIDEIHRFNKAQQDILTPHLEKGTIILIGATVHNPFFSIVSPLLSRSLVCQLYALSEQEIIAILKRALKDKIRGLGSLNIAIDNRTLRFLAKACQGDARRALNALEIGSLTTPKDREGRINFSLEIAQESIQKKALLYDRDEDAHYDTASAFIKSMRGSDPDAALYWLAKMLYAGEDPRFIARRICICASEDVGNADPQALILANAACQITEFVGMPEARIPLAQAAVYVACAPKSNASYIGIEKATEDIEKDRVQEVPDHLKDASYRGAERLGHGEGYKYAHNYKNHFVKQDYMQKKKVYYRPTDIGFEKEIKKRLESLR
jgi:putative ATPase